MTDDEKQIFVRLTDSVVSLNTTVAQARVAMEERATPRVSVDTVILSLAGAFVVGSMFLACAR
jgi:hypothetical protein